MRIVYSSERRSELSQQLGLAHYSYRFVEQRFVAALERSGIECVYLPAPEMLKTPLSFQQVLGCAPSDVVHIAFRSTENIRPVAGALNIVHFAWEFDVLRNDGLPSQPVKYNQVHMLSLVDEIWVPCHYTLDVLQSYGLKKAELVPTPVVSEDQMPRIERSAALSSLSMVPVTQLVASTGMPVETNAQSVARHLQPLGTYPGIDDPGCQVFLTICNPHDLRKNLLNIVDGFRIAVGNSTKHLLIVKLVVPNKGDFRTTQLYWAMMRLHDNNVAGASDDRVIFLFDYLSDEQMHSLYCLADYYICAAHCEGFNLPLLEAMARETVPISTANTAMADYVSDPTAFIIAERRFYGAQTGMSGDTTEKAYAVDVADRFDVARAISRALDAAPGVRRRKAVAAAALVRERFSEAPIVARVRERLAAHGRL